MALIVQKYGGTSVANLERIEFVAQKIGKFYEQNHKLVVVVSAMAGETDRLINLARNIFHDPPSRELDALVATGEQVSVALLSMALEKLSYAARSYTGWQAGIQTDAAHNKARIQHIATDKIFADLEENRIVVVAGFQGMDEAGRITTLGRGGSDTTAVALAAALNADECQIYTDVEGVFTSDPRVVSEARLLSHITFEEMLELASLGAKVLQIRAVEFAGKYHVPLRVASTFSEGGGTLITYESNNGGQPMEQPKVTGIAFNRSEARLTLQGVPNRVGLPGAILKPISEAHIDIDMIIQNYTSDGMVDFTFTVHRDDFTKAQEILDSIVVQTAAKGVVTDNKIAKISIVGVGMRSHPGIASTMFNTLGDEGINIQMISTSEIKTSVVIDEKYTELGVRALHAAFKLEQEPQEEFDPINLKKIPL